MPYGHISPDKAASLALAEKSAFMGWPFGNSGNEPLVINVHRPLILALCLGLPGAPGVAVADDTPQESDREQLESDREPLRADRRPLKADRKPLEIVLRPGDRGDSVERLQRLLREEGYLWGRVSGVYDNQTAAAVWGFQKLHGIRPHSKVDHAVWRALNHPRRPRPLVPKGARDRVEIDLRRQMLVVYRDRRPVLITHMSSGAGVTFCNGGRCRTAITPVGDFRVTTRAPGWTTGPLGSMYNSLYFVGGVAMHGSTKVPLWPASHGCVRLPMKAADRLYHLVGIGEPVHVRGRSIVARRGRR